MSTREEKHRVELLQGTLDLLILQVIAIGPMHGYAVGQRLQQITRDALQVQQGSLYPALHRLENAGMLKGSWAPTATGRDAKFYKLTAKGRRRLETEVSEWRELSKAIAMVLGEPRTT